MSSLGRLEMKQARQCSLAGQQGSAAETVKGWTLAVHGCRLPPCRSFIRVRCAPHPACFTPRRLLQVLRFGRWVRVPAGQAIMAGTDAHLVRLGSRQSAVNSPLHCAICPALGSVSRLLPALLLRRSVLWPYCCRPVVYFPPAAALLRASGRPGSAARCVPGHGHQAAHAVQRLLLLLPGKEEGRAQTDAAVPFAWAAAARVALRTFDDVQEELSLASSPTLPAAVCLLSMSPSPAP